MRLRFLPLLLLLVAPLGRAHAAPDARTLLATAVSKWADDVNGWTFVQHVRERQRDGTDQVRVERFHPSRPDAQRWELISIDGRTPSAEQQRAFDARKNRKPRKRIAEPLRYIDFDRIAVLGETDETVSLEVPLRGDLSFFIPFEAVAVRVEIDRETATLRRLDVGLRHEMRIAFGLARVSRLDLQFEIEPESGGSLKTGGTPGIPAVRASAVMLRFGRRAEISWSGFERVRSAPLDG